MRLTHRRIPMKRAIKTLLMWLTLSLPVFAGEFNFASFDFPTCTDTLVNGLKLRCINQRGDITGIYANSDVGPLHAFLLKDGVFTTIDYPGRIETDDLVINNSGLIAGFYFDVSGGSHGFVAVEQK
jgi:hypothetical protein